MYPWCEFFERERKKGPLEGGHANLVHVSHGGNGGSSSGLGSSMICAGLSSKSSYP